MPSWPSAGPQLTSCHGVLVHSYYCVLKFLDIHVSTLVEIAVAGTSTPCLCWQNTSLCGDDRVVFRQRTRHLQVAVDSCQRCEDKGNARGEDTDCRDGERKAEPCSGVPGEGADRSKEGRDSEASRKRVRSLRCCGNGPERVPYKWKQTEFCSLESHWLSESSVTKKGQRVEKVTKRTPQN